MLGARRGKTWCKGGDRATKSAAVCRVPMLEPSESRGGDLLGVEKTDRKLILATDSRGDWKKTTCNTRGE